MRNTLEQQKPLVVLVEDTAAIREMLSALLSQNGFSVSAFETAGTALAAWPELSGSTALLISDAMLDGGGAATMVPAMRVARPDLRVLVISGFSGAQASVPPRCEFMAKPFAMQELLAKIRHMLAR